MNEAALREMLSQLQQGSLGVEEALQRLRLLPYEDIGMAKLDHHRALRTGFPEVVFCQGKTPVQAAVILRHLADRHPLVMGTRASREIFEEVRGVLGHAVYHEVARIIVVAQPNVPAGPSLPRVAVVSAGTADLPVVEEAAITLEVLGHGVERVTDVGVAGIHRLLDQLPLLWASRALIVVAGMEGALPSVVAGLTGRPLVAVPTSVGYGANFQGLAPLLTMLNSCAPGVAVVNIDNGFGAALFAHLITRDDAGHKEAGG